MIRPSPMFFTSHRFPIPVLDISLPMPTILFSAPYMLPLLEHYRPIFDHYNLDLITPEVQERLEETDLLKCAGQFDGAICCDYRFSARVL